MSLENCSGHNQDFKSLQHRVVSLIFTVFPFHPFGHLIQGKYTQGLFFSKEMFQHQSLYGCLGGTQAIRSKSSSDSAIIMLEMLKTREASRNPGFPLLSLPQYIYVP